MIDSSCLLQTTVELNKDETVAFNEKCELGEVFKETCQTISILVDDEELERQEGLVNPPLTCSCHTATSGSCFLCKGMCLGSLLGRVSFRSQVPFVTSILLFVSRFIAQVSPKFCWHEAAFCFASMEFFARVCEETF